jgi:hypothetical protein
MTTSTQLHMIKLFDHVIPASLRSDAVQWRAARHLSILAAVTAVSVPLLTVMYHLLGYDAVGMVVLTAGVVMMVTPFMLTGVGLAVARDVFISALFLLKIWMAVYLGGVSAPTASWFVLCPAVALLVGGLRPGLIWSALVLAAIVIVFVLGYTGMLPPPPTDSGMTILSFASLVGLLALVVLIVALAVGAAGADRRSKF